MNAFDLVVTVALGSTLATVLLNRNVPLADGVAALGTLTLLQGVVSWASVRSRRFRDIVRSQPALLFYKGEMLNAALARERVIPDEVRAAIRSSGVASLEEVGSVVLETDGTFSVLRQLSGSGSALTPITERQST
jgi:uncharacterized membrane protein YcaP (DUF421 family)